LVFLDLIKLFEEFFDEIKILILSVSSFNDAPICEPLFTYDRDEGKSLALGNGTIDSDLFVGSGPGFLSGHVQIEARFVQEVDLGMFV